MLGKILHQVNLSLIPAYLFFFFFWLSPLLPRPIHSHKLGDFMLVQSPELLILINLTSCVLQKQWNSVLFQAIQVLQVCAPSTSCMSHSIRNCSQVSFLLDKFRQIQSVACWYEVTVVIMFLASKSSLHFNFAFIIWINKTSMKKFSALAAGEKKWIFYFRDIIHDHFNSPNTKTCCFIHRCQASG